MRWIQFGRTDESCHNRCRIIAESYKNRSTIVIESWQTRLVAGSKQNRGRIVAESWVESDESDRMHGFWGRIQESDSDESDQMSGFWGRIQGSESDESDQMNRLQMSRIRRIESVESDSDESNAGVG